MKYIQRSIAKYLEDLGAKMPAPGGGSAAALSAAMAAALIGMSCHFTVGKEKYRKFGRRAKAILAQSATIRRRLAALVDEDIEAYGRQDVRRAIEVPAQVCFLSADLLRYAGELMARGNKNLFSDAALAASLAEAAFAGSFLYVRCNMRNLGGSEGKRYARLFARLKSLAPQVSQMGKNAEVDVGRAFRR